VTDRDQASALMTPDSRGVVVLAATGEVYDTRILAEAAALVERAAEIERNARDAKRFGQDALRAELASQGRAELLIGDYQVTEATGTVTWDADQLRADLEAAGLSRDRLEELFGYRVRDGQELGKLERRHEAYAEAIERARSRARGRLVVKRKGAPLIAPRAGDAQQQKARELAQVEGDASELGI
jgi:hypothetical protein